jgi:hypothetical protein
MEQKPQKPAPIPLTIGTGGTSSVQDVVLPKGMTAKDVIAATAIKPKAAEQ